MIPRDENGAIPFPVHKDEHGHVDWQKEARWWQRHSRELTKLNHREKQKVGKVARWLINTYGPEEGDKLCKQLLCFQEEQDRGGAEDGRE